MAEHDSVIPAGGSGKLTAKVKTRPTQNGKVSKSISVETDAPGAERIVLRLSFEVSAPIVIKPSPRMVLSTISGEAKTSRVLLHRADGKPLVVRRVDVPDPERVRARTIAAKAGERHGAEDGDVWLEVTVRPDATAATRTDTVKVLTNHPQAPTLAVPVTLRVRGLVEASPQKLSLYYSEDTPAGRSAIIRVRHNRGKAIEIRDLEVSDPEIFRATNLSTQAASVVNIRLDLAEGVNAKTLARPINGSLRITCSEEEQSVLEVPVLVSHRTFARNRAGAPQVRPVRPPHQQMLRPTQPASGSDQKN